MSKYRSAYQENVDDRVRPTETFPAKLSLSYIAHASENVYEDNARHTLEECKSWCTMRARSEKRLYALLELLQITVRE